VKREVKAYPVAALQIEEEARHRLTTFLARVERGDPHDYRSPLYDSKPREDIIDMAREALGLASIKEFDDSDEREIEKTGSFSIMQPASERYANLFAHWDQNWSADERAFKEAVRRVRDTVRRRSLRPSEWSTAYNAMPKDTNLGLPHWTRDKAYAESYLVRAQQVREPSDIYPYGWGWRGQSRGLHELPKQRDVWMSDHAETIISLRFLNAYLKVLRELPGYAAWSNDLQVDLAITDLLSHAKRVGVAPISMDYSSFDATLHKRMLWAAFMEILAEWFQPGNEEMLEILYHVTANGSIVTPMGVLYNKDGSMTSGTGNTNGVDTICNRVAQEYAAIRTGTEIVCNQTLGDDAVVLFNKQIRPDALSSVLGELGLIVNPDKQFIHDYCCHFLQRIHSLNYQIGGVCHGVRSPFRTLNSSMSYERFRDPEMWNGYLDSARWIMQMENSRWDPRFTQFVQFMKEGDDIMRSQLDPVEIFQLAGGPEAIRRTLRIASFPFNVQNPEGVNRFITTKVLRGLAA